MLDNISWGDYFTVLIIALLLYYTAVAVIFYRDEIGALLNRKALPADNENTDNAPVTEKYEVFTGLEDVIEDIGGILRKAGKEASKQELLAQLSGRLASYPGFRHPAFLLTINNYIIRHGQQLCGLTFSAAELNEEWERLAV